MYCEIAGCKNNGNCIMNCDINKGRILALFIEQLDVINADIGELRKQKSLSGAEYSRIVSGIQLDFISEPAHLLSEVSQSITYSTQFRLSDGSDIKNVLRKYCKAYRNVEGEEQTIGGKQRLTNAELMEKLNNLQTNKLLPMLFKPKTECLVTKPIKGSKDLQTKIEFIKWHTDKETSKLIGEIVTLGGGESVIQSTRYKFKFSEYGTSFRLPRVEIGLPESNINRNVIRVTDTGLIEPICFYDGKIALGVDGRYIYGEFGEDTIVIGDWQMGKPTIQDTGKFAQDVKTSKAFKELLKYKEFINSHRRFIAPYEFMKPSIEKRISVG